MFWLLNIFLSSFRLSWVNNMILERSTVWKIHKSSIHWLYWWCFVKSNRLYTTDLVMLMVYKFHPWTRNLFHIKQLFRDGFINDSFIMILAFLKISGSFIYFPNLAVMSRLTRCTYSIPFHEPQNLYCSSYLSTLLLQYLHIPFADILINI